MAGRQRDSGLLEGYHKPSVLCPGRESNSHGALTPLVFDPAPKPLIFWCRESDSNPAGILRIQRGKPTLMRACPVWARRDSNSHEVFTSQVFETCLSTIPALAHVWDIPTPPSRHISCSWCGIPFPSFVLR
jgi:hypothetical protein